MKNVPSINYMRTSDGDSYKQVFVAGGSRGVGCLVVDKLVSTGSNVVALVQSDESVKELSALEGVTAIWGDALDYKTVEGANGWMRCRHYNSRWRESCRWKVDRLHR